MCRQVFKIATFNQATQSGAIQQTYRIGRGGSLSCWNYNRWRPSLCVCVCASVHMFCTFRGRSSKIADS